MIFMSDTDKWISEVDPLVGKADIYVYPYGEYVINDSHLNLAVKHKYLRKKGFRLFCGVGIKSYFTHLPDTRNKALFMHRMPFDVFTIHNRKNFSTIF